MSMCSDEVRFPKNFHLPTITHCAVTCLFIGLPLLSSCLSGPSSLLNHCFLDFLIYLFLSLRSRRNGQWRPCRNHQAYMDCGQTFRAYQHVSSPGPCSLSGAPNGV